MLKKQSGFTLTECVIALAIVGIIAAFTLPQIMYSTNETGQIAKYKVAYSVAADIVSMYAMEDPDTRPVFNTYFFNKIRALKKCPNGAATDGCFDAQHPIWNTPHANEPAVLLESGTAIILNSYLGVPYGILIDCDGPEGENREGVDQITFFPSVGTQAQTPPLDSTRMPSGQARSVAPGDMVSYYHYDMTGLTAGERLLVDLTERIVKGR